MTFEDILMKTMKWEGGFSDNSNDAGGNTNWGITQATLTMWRGTRVSADDVRSLTREEAIEIYQKMYFETPKFNLLPEVLEGPCFDFGVNAGPGRAVKTLQTLCNKIGAAGQVGVDGGMGPMTLNAVHKCIDDINEANFVNAYQDERANFYRSLVASTPSDAEFLQGWLNRVNDWRIPV